MTNPRLTTGIASLPASEQWLLKLFLGMALVALTLGVAYGVATAFARAGLATVAAPGGQRLLTLHGVTIFFYWLYFVQAALLLILTAVYTEGAGAIAGRGYAWLGFALMVGGFVCNQYAATGALPLLYDAPPELAQQGTLEAKAFYLGYLLLALGLFAVAGAAVATAFKPRFRGVLRAWSVISFAAVAWAGLLMVSAIAALNVFIPAAWWAFGGNAAIENHASTWHVLFHNMHYLPLMAVVLVWYALIEAMTGVKSIFGARFSKIVFALYLLLVPPTSLYHMFLEPNLAEPVRIAGSLLSLFISVPTVLAFLLIVVSLETHARARGSTGLFGWLRQLPWRNPAMAAVGMAAWNLAIGGALAFVLIQERLAPLLSDTFFVPGYFHFLTVGTVTLTFLAALMYAIPALTGHPLWRPRWLAAASYLVTVGLLVFGGGGVVAGYSGVPRRVFDIAYGGAAPNAWPLLMAIVGCGAALMAAGLLLQALGLSITLIAPRKQSVPADLPACQWGDVEPDRGAAWTGPLAIAVLVVGMMILTAVSFELLQRLPLVAGASSPH
ncbi:MAG: cbb3-type cytochrome c oxidase subunit I [Gammaproteobacteria bacterium]